jgi:two-component system response regulator AtoC
MPTNKAFTIFIVEDNEWYNKLLVHNLSLDPDFEIQSFFTAKDLLKSLDHAPNVITIDYRLPDMLGDELLEKIKNTSPETEVIVISEQEDIETAINTIKAGAYDYIVKTNDIRDRLFQCIRNIQKNSGLRKRITQLESEVQQKYAFEKAIIGQSPAIQQVFALMSKSLTSNINVTISGETGTGKEMVAKAIHYNSSYKSKPFISVNVAAIPKDLFESELFGHEKGAFTGASDLRIGKFEEANGGTLFLDEIGELDIYFQAKLLRALQEKEITRIGSNKVVPVNCRIIVATHKNLMDEVKKGNFREDLYYRLFGLPIHLPPLRDRENDVLILAKYFIRKFCEEHGLTEKSISKQAQLKMLSYPWPGNIRELKSVSELAVILSTEDEISSNDVMLSNSDEITSLLTEEMTLRDYNLRIVNLYLTKYQQNIKLVAEKLGIGQTTIYRMLKGEQDTET